MLQDLFPSPFCLACPLVHVGALPLLSLVPSLILLRYIFACTYVGYVIS